MGDLTKVSHVLDSREVAKMVGKKHAHLCRDIAGYAKALTESNFGFSDFFIEASYKDASGKSNKRYDITKQGCEMVANKLTGKKGILFTAEYMKRFNEMEQADAAAARDSYMIEDPIARAQAWIRERQQYNDAITEVEKSKQIIGELKPKADYTDRILNSKSLVSITQIAKDYGLSGKAMNGMENSTSSASSTSSVVSGCSTAAIKPKGTRTQRRLISPIRMAAPMWS